MLKCINKGKTRPGGKREGNERNVGVKGVRVRGGDKDKGFERLIFGEKSIFGVLKIHC